MTRVEKETLLALHALGRRQPHTTYEVTMKRLQLRHGWKEPKRPHSIRNNEMCQYLGATEKWISSFLGRGLAEGRNQEVKAGPRLQLYVGPFYMITKEGQKLARRMA